MYYLPKYNYKKNNLVWVKEGVLLVETSISKCRIIYNIMLYIIKVYLIFNGILLVQFQ